MKFATCLDSSLTGEHTQHLGPKPKRLDKAEELKTRQSGRTPKERGGATNPKMRVAHLARNMPPGEMRHYQKKTKTHRHHPPSRMKRGHRLNKKVNPKAIMLKIIPGPEGWTDTLMYPATSVVPPKESGPPPEERQQKCAHNLLDLSLRNWSGQKNTTRKTHKDGHPHLGLASSRRALK